jgi:hypothetical protein
VRHQDRASAQTHDEQQPPDPCWVLCETKVLTSKSTIDLVSNVRIKIVTVIYITLCVGKRARLRIKATLTTLTYL